MAAWIVLHLLWLLPLLVGVAIPDYFPGLLEMEGHAAQNIPQLIFWPLALVVVALAHAKQWSLVPVLGLLSCCWLLTGMEVSNWIWFSVWLVIGLVCYFAYGYRHSKLNLVKAHEAGRASSRP